VKLSDSYYFTRPHTYIRNVETKTPLKHYVQTRGARPPSFGSGYIFPRKAKGLYWPGLGHPIRFVGNPITGQHPGIKANPFEKNVLRKYTGSTSGGTLINTAWVGDTTASWYVETLTNMINNNLPGVSILKGLGGLR